MRVINTAKLNPKQLNYWDRSQVYNGLDSCVTHEILDQLVPKLNINTARTYEFSKELQGPVLEMRINGIKVDLARRANVVEEYFQLLDRMEQNLERIVREGADFVGFNWRSVDCLRTLFFDIFKIPIMTMTKGGQPSVNRVVLEKMEQYAIAYPIIQLMKEMREIAKRISVLKTEIDSDGRMRTSYNIAGTTTGRFNSTLSEYGTGTNMQNVEEGLREIFVADEGMKLANFDAEQGESRCVGATEWNLFHNGTYLDACESGDLHTYVAKVCWPGLPWPGGSGDRDLAEQPYYRHYSRRFMCKKLGHGSNYGGRPETLATQTKTDLKIIREFQPKYFGAFPFHHHWHSWVEEQIRAHQRLTTLTGRLRHFFGRPDSPDTIRDAIAYDPQGSLSDIVNHGMLQVWRANDCQLLLQNHDSILVQYPQEREDEVIPKILKQLEYEVPLRHGRTLMIPYGCQTGWNWGKASNKNPDGLQEYEPNDQRTRTPQVHILDRKLR